MDYFFRKKWTDGRSAPQKRIFSYILLLYKIVTIFCLYNPLYTIPYLGEIEYVRFSLQESSPVDCDCGQLDVDKRFNVVERSPMVVC